MYTGWRRTHLVEGGLAAAAVWGLLASLTALVAASALCLALAPRLYRSVRWRASVVQHVLRSVAVMAFYSLITAERWDEFLARRPSGEAPAQLVLELLVLMALLSMFHTLLFPVAFRHSAPLQVAFCAAGCWPARGLACAMRRNAPYLEGARDVCRRAQTAKHYASIVAGAVGSPAPAKLALCDAAPMELLVPLFSALSCLGTLWILYLREWRLKVRFVSSDAAAPPGAAAHVCGAACVLLASFAIAEAAAAWGRPYDCGA